MKLRQELSAPGLLNTARQHFQESLGGDQRISGKTDFSMADTAMCAVAMFNLKFPSMLQFDTANRTDDVIQHNLRTLFGVHKAPSDTQMREILDPVDPRAVRGVFKSVFTSLQRGKILEEFVYFNDSYLLSLDATGYFSSGSVSCSSCCIKEHRDGKTTYYHQILSGVLVHPEKKGVIPFAPEAIVQQDGTQKNDCERNAGERFLEDFRREHPHLKVIVTEDGLGSNAPHIATLKRLNFNYILGCKPGDHRSLFEFIEASEKLGEVQKWEIQEGKVHHRFRWMKGVPLNDSNPDCQVGFLEYWETQGDKVKHWSWVTDLDLSEKSVYRIMRAGRARWAIENETFNTLKNQGYCFEHNFGHGKKNLSVVLAQLMMLAFLIDQAQQLACALFQQAKIRLRIKERLWGTMRFFFEHFLFESWEEYLGALAVGIKRKAVELDTS